jgi:diguanylate cyclase
MSLYPAENPYGPDTCDIAATATSVRARWSQAQPDADVLRRALAISGQQLKVARRRLDEFQERDLLLRQKVALLEDEVAKAHRFACHDELTGLPNRRLLQDRFNQVVARGIRQHQQVVLLFIDLNGFKGLNDAFGHAVGDRVLEQVGARLTGCIRASDTACRYGGDEFVVLLPEIQDQEQAIAVTAKIRAELDVPYAVGNSTITNSASIGMAVFPTDGCELGELIQASDRNMYRNKAHGFALRRADPNAGPWSGLSTGAASQAHPDNRPYRRLSPV